MKPINLQYKLIWSWQYDDAAITLYKNQKNKVKARIVFIGDHTTNTLDISHKNVTGISPDIYRWNDSAIQRHLIYTRARPIRSLDGSYRLQLNYNLRGGAYEDFWALTGAAFGLVKIVGGAALVLSTGGAAAVVGGCALMGSGAADEYYIGNSNAQTINFGDYLKYSAGGAMVGGTAAAVGVAATAAGTAAVTNNQANQRTPNGGPHHIPQPHGNGGGGGSGIGTAVGVGTGTTVINRLVNNNHNPQAHNPAAQAGQKAEASSVQLPSGPNNRERPIPVPATPAPTPATVQPNINPIPTTPSPTPTTTTVPINQPQKPKIIQFKPTPTADSQITDTSATKAKQKPEEEESSIKDFGAHFITNMLRGNSSSSARTTTGTQNPVREQTVQQPVQQTARPHTQPAAVKIEITPVVETAKETVTQPVIPTKAPETTSAATPKTKENSATSSETLPDFGMFGVTESHIAAAQISTKQAADTKTAETKTTEQSATRAPNNIVQPEHELLALGWQEVISSFRAIPTGHIDQAIAAAKESNDIAGLLLLHKTKVGYELGTQALVYLPSFLIHYQNANGDIKQACENVGLDYLFERAIALLPNGSAIYAVSAAANALNSETAIQQLTALKQSIQNLEDRCRQNGNDFMAALFRADRIEIAEEQMITQIVALPARIIEELKDYLRSKNNGDNNETSAPKLGIPIEVLMQNKFFRDHFECRDGRLFAKTELDGKAISMPELTTASTTTAASATGSNTVSTNPALNNSNAFFKTEPDPKQLAAAEQRRLNEAYEKTRELKETPVTVKGVANNSAAGIQISINTDHANISFQHTIPFQAFLNSLLGQGEDNTIGANLRKTQEWLARSSKMNSDAVIFHFNNVIKEVKALGTNISVKQFSEVRAIADDVIHSAHVPLLQTGLTQKLPAPHLSEIVKNVNEIYSVLRLEIPEDVAQILAETRRYTHPHDFSNNARCNPIPQAKKEDVPNQKVVDKICDHFSEAKKFASRTGGNKIVNKQDAISRYKQAMQCIRVFCNHKVPDKLLITLNIRDFSATQKSEIDRIVLSTYCPVLQHRLNEHAQNIGNGAKLARECAAEIREIYQVFNCEPNQIIKVLLERTDRECAVAEPQNTAPRNAH